MENMFKHATEKASEIKEQASKLAKFLVLLAGLNVSEQAIAQNSIEQMIETAHKYELSISNKAKEKGELGTVIHESGMQSPTARYVSGNSEVRIEYADKERTHPKMFIVRKDGHYFIDNNADGVFDASYIDKSGTSVEHSNAADSKSEIYAQLQTGITGTEAEMDAQSHKKQYSYIDGKNFTITTTDEGGSTIEVPEDKKEFFTKTMQQKFINTLSSVDHE